MRLPTASDYRDAIQTPNTCFADPELKNGTPVTDLLGLPRAVSGNFASVFQINAPSGRRLAVRCFVRSADDQEQRYDAIAAFLAPIQASWKVDFQFLKEGIRVHGRWLPILKMEWLDAQPLNRFVGAQVNDRDTMLALARRFLELVVDLNRAGGAHGDLQHGNILVTGDGSLKLIDYDGMYVPALRGRQSKELGHRNYQHPARSSSDYGPGLDNFSAWVIYGSLVALAVDPSLWTRLAGGEEKLLLSHEDYSEPMLAQASRALELSADPILREIATLVRQNVRKRPLDSSELRELDVPSESHSGGSIPSAAPLHEALSSLPTNLPTSGQGDTSWLLSHLPAPAPVVLHDSLGALRWVTAGLLALGIALAAFALDGAVIVAAALAAGAALAAAGFVPVIAYCRTPEFKAKRERRKWVRETRELVTEHVSENERLRKALDEAANEAEKATEQARHDSAQRKRKTDQAIDRARLDMQKQLRDVAKQREKLLKDRQRAEAAALQRLQQSARQQELARHWIANARISGIGSGTADNLAACGVRTAADFTGVRIANGEAAIRLTGGRQIHVRGIGPAKAAALGQWRSAVEAQAQARLPQVLPATERQRLAAQTEESVRALEAQERSVTVECEKHVAQLRAELHDEERVAAVKLQERQAGIVQRRQAIVIERERSAALCRDAEYVAQQAANALLAYRNVTLRRFVGRRPA